MRGFRTLNARFVATSALCAVVMTSAIARADIILRDDGAWLFYTKGLVGSHYQFIKGDGDQTGMNLLVGGKGYNNVSQDENNNLAISRVRSGFIGTQIGFGVINKISETLMAKGFLAASINGIDNGKGSSTPKGVDFREGWAALEGRFGTFSFGRMFSIFASASGEVVAYAYANGVGHPCLVDDSTIACGSVGAGPLYAGFNAQFRYATPRLAGFGAQVSIEDPSALPDYRITPLPRVEGELSYEHDWASGAKVVVKGQGLAQKVARLNADGKGTNSVMPWGAMGVARVEAFGFKLGGGAWTGPGMGTHTPLQQDTPANPLAHDKPGGMDIPGGVLRHFRGFFGNLVYSYRSTSLAVGGGAANIRETDADAATGSGISLLKQNREFHVVLTKRIASVVLTAEFMQWKSEWHRGERQLLNFMGGGATFTW